MLGKHRLGIYEKALDSSDSWERRLEKAAELGFDFLEISVDESDSRLERLSWTEAQRYALADACRKTGLPITSMCLSAHRRFPFGSADPRVEARALEIMERAIELACCLGVRVIQLAAYDVYYEEETPDTAARYLENLNRAAELGEKYGIMLANEIMDTSFMNSISKHLEYEKRINSPWLRVYPDVGNLSAWGNDVAAELQKGLPSIVQVHLKDTLAVTEGFPGKFRDVAFGAGCVDFERCFEVLERGGYCGAYLIEMWHDKSRPDVESVAGAKRFIEERFKTALGI